MIKQFVLDNDNLDPDLHKKTQEAFDKNPPAFESLEGIDQDRQQEVFFYLQRIYLRLLARSQAIKPLNDDMVRQLGGTKKPSVESKELTTFVDKLDALKESLLKGVDTGKTVEQKATEAAIADLLKNLEHIQGLAQLISLAKQQGGFGEILNGLNIEDLHVIRQLLLQNLQKLKFKWHSIIESVDVAKKYLPHLNMVPADIDNQIDTLENEVISWLPLVGEVMTKVNLKEGKGKHVLPPTREGIDDIHEKSKAHVVKVLGLSDLGKLKKSEK